MFRLLNRMCVSRAAGVGGRSRKGGVLESSLMATCRPGSLRELAAPGPCCHLQLPLVACFLRRIAHSYASPGPSSSVCSRDAVDHLPGHPGPRGRAQGHRHVCGKQEQRGQLAHVHLCVTRHEHDRARVPERGGQQLERRRRGRPPERGGDGGARGPRQAQQEGDDAQGPQHAAPQAHRAGRGRADAPPRLQHQRPQLQHQGPRVLHRRGEVTRTRGGAVRPGGKPH
ncbi:MAG: hypothetical protein J3K34DRAFT_425034 [Monoraphidium minutum]|nr:MAG: hypothetical protein J3K34DRAFT_425034 [Monoraphidium minutum]